jgi:transcriptional regulator of acetoin/glycerol metabolism
MTRQDILVKIDQKEAELSKISKDLSHLRAMCHLQQKAQKTYSKLNFKMFNEKYRINLALKLTLGVKEHMKEASKLAEIPERTFYRRCRKYGFNKYTK